MDANLKTFAKFLVTVGTSELQKAGNIFLQVIIHTKPSAPKGLHCNSKSLKKYRASFCRKDQRSKSKQGEKGQKEQITLIVKIAFHLSPSLRDTLQKVFM